jgi:hypothetical protein
VSEKRWKNGGRIVTWEQWQRWQRHGVGGEARYVVRCLDIDGDGGSEGRKAEEEKCEKEGEEKGKDGG